MTEVACFTASLAKHLSGDIHLKIQENSTLFLSSKRDPHGALRISLHKVFLQAPEEVIIAIAAYVQGKRKNVRALKEYVHHFLVNEPQSRVSRRDLVAKGRVYDLESLYREVNADYFEASLSCDISWYGTTTRRARVRTTLGQYLAREKLIQINQLLDDERVPHFFITYIVYHEMLHALIPTRIDPQGRYCYHGPDFHAKEREFKEYRAAKAWEKENQHLFLKLKGGRYGRA